MSCFLWLLTGNAREENNLVEFSFRVVKVELPNDAVHWA